MMCVVALNFSCTLFRNEGSKPRLSMFIGIDISGSFIHGKHFDDALRFTAHYIAAHLKGLEGLDVPRTLFVGSIGGARPDEPKTFYPIQTFENLSVEQIIAKLNEIFPKKIENPHTDYNAFFEQVSMLVRDKRLVLRPISIVMMTDGDPDTSMDKKNENEFTHINLRSLENLSRDVTIRLLFTSAETGRGWLTKVKRRRVKIWTQDASVMTQWKEPNIMIPGKDLLNQQTFFKWILGNVDFAVRAQRVY